LIVSLYIRDYALIDELEVDFSSGLNIITGETGAGKSILVGALKLILGERAHTETIRSGSRKAIVEGVFEVSDVPPVTFLLEEGDFDLGTQLILRREVVGGKSRSFINDSPASLQQLRALGNELVDLHGQHEHQSLLRPEKHVGLIDSFGGLEGLYAAYREQYRQVADLICLRDELERKEGDLSQQRELFASQIEEIDRTQPIAGEEDDLIAERRILENAEKLFISTASLFDVLYEADESVQDLLVQVRNELQDLSRIDQEFDELQKEISSAQVAVSETAKALQEYNSRVEFNPDRLNEIRERLMDLDRLKLRYGGTIEAVLAHRKEIGEKHSVAVDFEGTLSRLDSEIRDEQSELSDVAIRQSLKRQEVAGRIEVAIVAELSLLGITDSKFEIRFERAPETDGWITDDSSGVSVRYRALASGMERATFCLSTNVGEEVKPLAAVASGGEISRVMLALKSILAKSDRLPLLIFDEIDAGVSGSMARRVGERLHSLARYHQIIAITHLPQVASMADTHYKIEKTVVDDRTSTSIKCLQTEERREEIAALISGEKVTEAARASAQELMDFRANVSADE